MLRITRKADYAVFIMTHLARRQRGLDGGSPGEGPVSAQQIATFSGLDKSLVANLLKDLQKAGLCDSVRGAHGGYGLAAGPERISLGQILRAIEGPFTIVPCANEAACAEPACTEDAGACDPLTLRTCSLEEACTAKEPFRLLQTRIQALLDGLTLTELAGLGALAAAPVRPIGP
jgi:Rrf2 family protein